MSWLVDKTWMIQPRNSDLYRSGVKFFLDFAFHHTSEDGKIMCPCRSCVNHCLQTYNEVEVHLVCDGFLKGYTRWVFHGELEFTIDNSSASLDILHTDEVESVQDCNMPKSSPWTVDDISGLLHDAAFFKAVCAKVVDVKELDKLQEHISLTICHMEMTFLPSFFTIMVHLMIHLVEEIKLGGPVQYRWMYSHERVLHMELDISN